MDIANIVSDVYVTDAPDTRLSKLASLFDDETDRGLYLASAEGFGAQHALNEAREVLKRQVRDQKTYGHSKKPRGEEYFEKRLGWLLEGAD